MASFSAEDAAKLQQKLQEIERLSRLLGANINTINLQPLEENAGAIEAIFERLTNQAEGLGEETDYLVSNFQKLIKNIEKSGTGIGEATKGLKSLSSITEQISNYQKGYNNLSSKEISKLRDKVKIETDRLKIAKDTLKEEGLEISQKIRSGNLAPRQLQIEQEKLAKILITRRNIRQLLQNENKTLGELNTKLKEAEDDAKRIEKALGVTGVVLKGISKIPILGDLVDTQEALKAAEEAAKNGAGKIGAMGAAIGSMGKSLVFSLNDPLVRVGLLTKGFLAFINLLTEADKATAELAKGMNMSYNDASKLRGQYAEIAKNAHDSYITIKGLQESQLAIAQTLGTTAKLNEQDLKTFTKLRDQAGYTNEELAEMQKLTLAVGGNLEGNVKSFAGTVAKLNLQNKLTINEKQLLKDVSKVSDSIKLSVGGTAEAIAKAAFKAKQFGINLEQADKISEGLLNFEESMTNEISAQLLTGKDINLEHARLLALNNDIAGASAEILSQVESAAEFSDMNRIQQEAIAKAVGLSRDELAKSLIEREALQKIGAKDAEEAAEKYRILRKTMTAEEAAKALKDEAYAKQLEQNAISEDFNKIIQQLKELFIPIAQELLPKIKELLGPEGGVQSLVDKIKSSFDTIKTVVEVIAAVIGVKMVAGLVSSVAQAVKLVSTLGQVNTSGGGGSPGSTGGIFSGGIGRLSRAYRGGGVEGLSKASGQILSKTLKGNALTALLMGGIEAGTNIAEGKGAGESIGRAALTSLFSLGGGALGSLIMPGAGTIGGGIAGGMLGDKIGNMIFGEPVEDADISSNGLVVGKYNRGEIKPIAQGRPDDNVIFTTNKPSTIKTPASISSPNINIDTLIKEQIQQEAITKAIGLSKDDLAKSLVEREALQKIGAKDAESEGFNKIIQQLKELFIPIAQQLFPKIKELLGPEGGVQSLVDKIKSSFDTIKTVVEVIITSLTSVLGGTRVALLTGGAGTIAGGMVGDKIGDMLFGEKKDEIEANVAKITQQKDGIIDNNGLIVGKYNEGQIQPIAQGLPEDNVMFTTNKPTTVKTPAPISSPNINIDTLIKEQQKTNDLLTRLYSKEGVIRYDSDIAGKNANISSYSI